MKIDKKNIDDILPMTPMQKSMLFTYLYKPNESLYFEQINIAIQQSLDIQAFMMAWEFVVDTNEVLRSVFAWENLKEPLQIVLKSKAIPIRNLDYSIYSSKEKKHQLEIEKKYYFEEKIINLNENPIQLSLVKMDSESYIMSINYHHILFDGWSLGIILKEFTSAYIGIVNKADYQSVKKTKYKEYLKRQLVPDSNAESYWKNYLQEKDYIGLPYLETHIGTRASANSRSYEFDLSGEMKQKLEIYLTYHQVTLASLVYSVWYILLQRYCLSDHIIFGTTVSGRIPEIQGMENMVGLFINTVPLCISSNGNGTNDLVKKVHHQLIARKEYEHVPYSKIEALSGKNIDNPLFHTIVAVENYPVGDYLKENQNSIFSIESIREKTNFLLALEVICGDKISLKVIYDECVSNLDIESLANRFVSILEVFLAKPFENKCTNQIKIVSELEENELLELNNTETDYPSNKSIVDLFNEQVVKHPKKIALISEDVSLTYNQLDVMSSQLAAYMEDFGVKKEGIIAIIAERSHETIVSVLAAIKAGCAYLPIDPQYPLSRIQNIIDDCDAEMLIVPRCSDIEFEDLSVLNIIHYDRLNFSNYNHRKINCNLSPNNLAYVMYTSGSTGRPKGVLVEHKNIVRLVKNSTTFPLNEDGRILQTGSIAFDASTFEIWGALLNGQCLVIRNKYLMLDATMLSKEIAEQQITTLWLTSPLFDQISEEVTKEFGCLQTLIIGGAKLTPQKVNKFRELFPNITVINGYGPTENTTFSTAFYIKDNFEKSIPIGRPISNSSVFVLDHHMNLQPKNMVGELFVGGDGLSRGYLNNPTLTSEKMVKSPIDDHRLYKTGDYVRWNESNHLEFINRRDDQVKIRGHRIELAELQSTLYSIDLVKEVVTIFQADKGINRIIAFVITVADKNMEEENTKSIIYKNLAKKLPEYMLPAEIVIVHQFPLTVNGKIDYDQLLVNLQHVKKTVVHETTLLKEVAELWKQATPGLVDGVEAHQDYFTVGGNSLTAISLTSYISKFYKFKVSVADVFTYRTLNAQAEWIAQQISLSAEKQNNIKSETDSLIDLVPKDITSYELSVIQKRFWFLSKIEGDTTYNVPIQFEWYKDVDITLANQAINIIIKRHEIFRTSFIEKHGEVRQFISEDSEIVLPYKDLSYLERQQQEIEIEKLVRSDLTKPFQYNNQPLIRGMIIKANDERSVLYFTTSHLIFDGWSLSIFIKEFLMIYRALEKKTDVSLPQLDYKYIHYVYWQKHFLEDTTTNQCKTYWKNQLSNIVLKQNGLSQINRMLNKTGNTGQVISFELPPSVISKLEYLGEKNNATMYMVLMSCYFILLHKITYQDDVTIGMPIAGRNHSSWNPLIGCFMNTLPIRIQMYGNMDLRILLERVRDVCIQAYRYDYPYDLLLHEINSKNGISNSLFQTMFQFNNIQSLLHDSEVQILVKDYTLVKTKFDYKLDMYQQAGRIIGRFEFNTEIIDKSQADEIIAEYMRICEGFAYCPDSNIESLLVTEKKLFDEEFGVGKI
ncbi:non-ribosomal peptide synthetase [Paenibacillus aquistagni]|uniref:non-ribosomal peptide synthetase n=1 Tax=Paenibacillus aquistagni TaxID=1852522 RepID=UPI00145A2465|nr:non-ribosomal peptide synthetase [Paenibacillus aquistagni]NMM55485.1 amino acid adenylation domain-containing protein [Paenibacillus aquistagni]